MKCKKYISMKMDKKKLELRKLSIKLIRELVNK